MEYLVDVVTQGSEILFAFGGKSDLQYLADLPAGSLRQKTRPKDLDQRDRGVVCFGDALGVFGVEVRDVVDRTVLVDRAEDVRCLPRYRQPDAAWRRFGGRLGCRLGSQQRTG